MKFISLIRRFSIRSRMMLTVTATILSLVCVGGVGLVAQSVAQSANHEFIGHDLAAMKLIAQLRTAMVQMRNHEKDMIIHYERPADVAKARAQWAKSLELAEQTARKLRDVLKTDSDRAKVDESIAHLAKFKQAFGPVAKQLEDQGFDSARSAWQFMTRAQGSYEAAQQKILAIAEDIDVAATAGGENLDITANRVKSVLVAAVALALGLIVPLTLLNMKTICEPIRAAEQLAGAIAQGDLTGDAETTVGRDEVAQLEGALWRMRSGLRDMVMQIRDSTETISVASQEISSGSMDLSHRTEKAAANLQETAGSMEQLTATVSESASSASEADRIAKTAAGIAQKGGAVMADVVATMESINDSSKHIAEIVSVIDGIAFQTNILALNAAVEAARAGSEGRGFAVVANEVRNLAQRSAGAAKQIKELVNTSVQRIENGSKHVGEAGTTMQEIVRSVQGVTTIIASITDAALRQRDGLIQVNTAVGHLDRMTQQNAALVEQSAAASESLKEQAVNLAQAIGTFKLEHHT